MPSLRSRPMRLILSKSVSGLRYFAHTTPLEAAQQAGLALSSACGGLGNCGQCRIAVLEGQVSSPTLHNHRSNPGRLAAGLTPSQGELNLVAEPIVICRMTPR